MPIWKRSKPGEPESAKVPPPKIESRAVSAEQSSRREDRPFRIENTIRLKGELIGHTDVEILGEVEGKVHVEGHDLIVGASGQVMAEVSAKSVRINGQVLGNVTASESILIGPGGCVLGDLCAPSIQLEDGSQFTGGINKQAEPAKVTGSLNRGGAGASPETAIEDSVAHAKEEGLYDRRGASRPRDDESNREDEN